MALLARGPRGLNDTAHEVEERGGVALFHETGEVGGGDVNRRSGEIAWQH